ncbi:MAG: hypothetical protein JKY47_06335 [Thalassospira sp.]|nr:hypothetical protein [Thalassospira sp.]
MKPENGLAYSCLMRSVIQESRATFKIVRGETDSYLKSKVPGGIDSDSCVLDHPDKMIFLIKEMKAHSDIEKLHLADPRVIAHLDLHSITNYKFKHDSP